jgi:POT family proton-dependent oligopeptide transporter
MMNNLTSQAATMNLGSTPNDIVAKMNPLFIIIVIPIMDFGIYPALRKAGVNCACSTSPFRFETIR